MRVPDNPTLGDLLGAVADSADRHAILAGGRADLGEIAQAALVQSLASVAGRELPQLFRAISEDLQSVPGQFAGKDSFGHLTGFNLPPLPPSF